MNLVIFWTVCIAISVQYLGSKDATIPRRTLARHFAVLFIMALMFGKYPGTLFAMVFKPRYLMYAPLYSSVLPDTPVRIAWIARTVLGTVCILCSLGVALGRDRYRRVLLWVLPFAIVSVIMVFLAGVGSDVGGVREQAIVVLLFGSFFVFVGYLVMSFYGKQEVVEQLFKKG